MAEFLEMQGMDATRCGSPKGCDKCRKTGYSGRVGIYELLVVDDQLRDIIARNPNVAEFRRLCLERGMVTLRQDGMRKVAKGLTTVQEVIRVTEAAGAGPRRHAGAADHRRPGARDPADRDRRRGLLIATGGSV
jgi:hypothetical protein